MLSQEIHGLGGLFQIVQLRPMGEACALLCLNVILDINEQADLSVLPFQLAGRSGSSGDPGGKGFFGVVNPQRFQTGEPFLIRCSGRDRHGIDTAEQLTDYRASADAQIKSLYSECKTLHNEQRRHDVPEARMVEIRARIAAISAQAKPLRRSMKLCDAIMERALVLAEKQAQIKQMEKEEKGHEKKQIKDRRRAIE